MITHLHSTKRVHPWLLKPEVSKLQITITMILSDGQETLPKLRHHCPTRLRVGPEPPSFQITVTSSLHPSCLVLLPKTPLVVAHPHSIKIVSVQPPSLNHSTALSRVLFLETWMHVSSSLIDVHVGSQPPQAFTSEKFKQTQFTNMQASANI